MSLVNNINLTPVIKWDYEDLEVNLYEKEKELFYVTNKNGVEIHVNKTQLIENLTNEQIIKILNLCDATVDEKGVASFYPKIHKYEVGDKRISLIASDSLLWHIKNKENKSMILDISSTVPSRRCHSETIKLIEEIKKNSLKTENVELLKKDFKITRVFKKERWKSEGLPEDDNTLKILAYSTALTSLALFLLPPAPVFIFYTGGITFYPIAKHLFNDYQKSLIQKKIRESQDYCIEIEPFSEPSFIESKARVSRFTWAVCILTGPAGFSKNHASILIEGIANDLEESHFLYEIHYNPRIKNRLSLP